MHARLDQLLSLRDGEPVDAEVRDHVQQCDACRAEIHRLSRMQERLQALPPIDPPHDFWRDIESKVDADRARPKWRFVAAAALVVVAGALGYLRSHDRESQTIARTETAATPSSAEIERLIAESRELEALLAYLPEPQVERVSTVAAVDSLEQRIQWLDWQLANADDDLDPQQTQRLWSQRVDLMDSLVKVRYAQSTAVF
jgi:hypothetical protein